MKNVLGNNLTITLFGESHGAEIGAILDGVTPGIYVDMDYIRHKLYLRRPQGKISTARQEQDEFRIVSGVYEGYTTGTPIAIIIPNTNTKSKDYSKTRFLARPGHADLTANMKYHGFEDFRGGGHFSGRITAAIVAASAITDLMLQKKNIKIGSHIARLGGVSDRKFENLSEDIDALNEKVFPVLSETASEKMNERIMEAREKQDSIGGILETAILNMPTGVGEPWFDTLESMLSHAIFSVPAVKGVVFGDALDLVDAYGSEYNDSFRVENGTYVTETNHNAGINGGITNGMPIVIKSFIKPTPSIYQKQDTVNFEKKENAEIEIEGRHDPSVIHRARIVVDSMCSLVLADTLIGRFGTDYFLGE